MDLVERFADGVILLEYLAIAVNLNVEAGRECVNARYAHTVETA